MVPGIQCSFSTSKMRRMREREGKWGGKWPESSGETNAKLGAWKPGDPRETRAFLTVGASCCLPGEPHEKAADQFLSASAGCVTGATNIEMQKSLLGRSYPQTSFFFCRENNASEPAALAHSPGALVWASDAHLPTLHTLEWTLGLAYPSPAPNS